MNVKKENKEEDLDKKLRKLAVEKVNFRISIYIDIFAFLFYNSALYIVNIMMFPDYLWIIYPFFGWLIGLTIHIANYIMYSRGIKDGVVISLVNHTAAYISVMCLLTIISLYHNGIAMWVIISYIFWGFGLVCHYIVFFYTTGGASRRRNAIERELHKMISK